MSFTPWVLHTQVVGLPCSSSIARIDLEWPMVVRRWIEPEDVFAYANILRMGWHSPGELVVVEHDVVPPVGSIRRLFECKAGWCTHPHPLGGKMLTDSLGLAKFSWELRKGLSQLADRALAAHDGREMVGRGLSRIPADQAANTSERRRQRATLRSDAANPFPDELPGVWPSTVDWRTCDSHLARALRGLGYEPHVHPIPTVHLKHTPGG